MPLNAVGWTTEEEEKLIELVEPHTYLYDVQDPSRKNILAREHRWNQIGQALTKPVDECKKRWRGLRDSYMRSIRMGSVHKTKAEIFNKLQFLNVMADTVEGDSQDETIVESEQEVITDTQEYYEFTVVDGPMEQKQFEPVIKIVSNDVKNNEPKKIARKPGRKRSIPIPRNVPPIKILPKPIVMNGPKIVHYVEDKKTPEQRSQTIDKLIEKVLKENTNEIDVFFRSMAASVKKLQPNLIPKVKMEVCNVIAKYEMQNFDNKM